jgi:hypothetical protein
MESTRLHWIPVFEVLEAEGLEFLLVNARGVNNVLGRKTDVRDAQWLQQLHQYGLFAEAFDRVPALLNYEDICVIASAWLSMFPLTFSICREL